MRYYNSGAWGFSLVWGLDASVFPRAICLAIPNAILAFIVSELYVNKELGNSDEDTTKNAMSIFASFTSVLFFVLYFRSNIAYDRWWEGGTLLQKTRGEWFNAYSSLMAFTATSPEKEREVEEFQHAIARLMSLLFCCGLQQVSPNKDRPFEIIDSYGIDPASLRFLHQSQDKVEVILQWIQRLTVLHMYTGVLPVAPPVLSRAFQEVSRGIVNLQNARKIADFPFPFPFAQTSMVMLLIHWGCTPILCAQMMAVAGGAWGKFMAAGLSFVVIFFIWCINYIALQLEMPFGSAANDLPMNLMQRDWNKSIGTLLANRAKNPPSFRWEPSVHRKLELAMSDGSNTERRRITLPENPSLARENSELKTGERLSGRASWKSSLFKGSPQGSRQSRLGDYGDDDGVLKHHCSDDCASENYTSSAEEPPSDLNPSSFEEATSSSLKCRGGVLSDIAEQPGEHEQAEELGNLREALKFPTQFKIPEDNEGLVRAAPSAPSGSVILDMDIRGPQAKVQETPWRAVELRTKSCEEPQREEKLSQFPNHHVVDAAGFDTQLRMVGARMKELHACLIDEELSLLSALGTRLASTDTTVDKSRPVVSIGI